MPIATLIIGFVAMVLLVRLNHIPTKDGHWHEHRGRMRRWRKDRTWETRELTPEEQQSQFEDVDSGAW